MKKDKRLMVFKKTTIINPSRTFRQFEGLDLEIFIFFFFKQARAARAAQSKNFLSPSKKTSLTQYLFTGRSKNFSDYIFRISVEKYSRLPNLSSYWIFFDRKKYQALDFPLCKIIFKTVFRIKVVQISKIIFFSKCKSYRAWAGEYDWGGFKKKRFPF